MRIEKNREIAASFANQYEEIDLNIKLTKSEFSRFENGIYAGSMDEKWNIFVIDNNMYWARSWTNNCIYRIGFERIDETIELKKLQVTRNTEAYKGTDIEFDLKMFKKMLDYYLNKYK